MSVLQYFWDTFPQGGIVSPERIQRVSETFGHTSLQIFDALLMTGWGVTRNDDGAWLVTPRTCSVGNSCVIGGSSGCSCHSN